MELEHDAPTGPLGAYATRATRWVFGVLTPVWMILVAMRLPFDGVVVGAGTAWAGTSLFALTFLPASLLEAREPREAPLDEVPIALGIHDWQRRIGLSVAFTWLALAAEQQLGFDLGHAALVQVIRDPQATPVLLWVVVLCMPGVAFITLSSPVLTATRTLHRPLMKWPLIGALVVVMAEALAIVVVAGVLS